VSGRNVRRGPVFFPKVEVKVRKVAGIGTGTGIVAKGVMIGR